MPSERFLDLYLAESRDCVRRLTTNALALERGERGALAEAFRAAHTLKGMAAAMGHQPVAAAAHALEDRLSEVRDGRPVDAVLIDDLLRAADGMEVALSGDVLPGAAAPRGAVAGGGDPSDSWEAVPPVEGATAAVSIRLAADVPLKAARALTLVGQARRSVRVVAVRPDPAADGFDGVFHVYVAGPAEASWLAGLWRSSSEIAALEVRAPGAGGEAPAGPARTRTIRVDRERLDRLAEGIAELAVHFAADPGGNDRERAAAVVAGLQRTILELRTVPVSVIADRATRVVRDAARALGKEIDLEFAGGEIELDQAILDSVTEPLMHLLRNAADHGIEAPAEREARGKPRRGRIRLEAGRERASVRISVTDDGRGVAREVVRAEAARRGLDDPGSGEDEVLRVLVQPGFTTAAGVTGMSGRGVGLDAVAAQVRGLGGAIDMTTCEGKGATFTLRVPFTLAIVHGLRVRVAGDEYALPLTHVAEIAHLGCGTVRREGEREYVMVRDVAIPLLRLRAVLGLPATGQEGAAIIAELGERRLALAVDGVLEHEPIVVKRFDAPTGVPAIFSGATLRPDGRPLLLLDPLSAG